MATARDIIFIQDLSAKDVTCSGTGIRFKQSSFVLDETGGNAPVAGAAPANPPTGMADNAIAIELYDDLTRYWEYDAATTTWTNVADQLDTAGAGAVTVTDTASINLTLTGSDIKGDVLYSANAGNAASAGGDGGVFAAYPTIAAGSANFIAITTGGELSVSALAITDVTVDAAELTMAAYVTANYTGAEHQEGDTIILTAATGGTQTWMHNGGVAGTIADFTQIAAPPTSTTFTLAGDTGANQALADGDTITLAGGSGIATVGGATDTVTFNLDITGLTADTITAADELAFYDASGTDNNKITFANFEGTLNHDNLAGFVANEHIDHTAVSIATAAGSGLTGGGTIAATRNIAVDITGQTAATPVLADELMIYDASATALRKVSFADVQTLLAQTFTLAGDSGASQTISGGDTMTIAGGTGIDSVASATDTITLNLNAAINDLSDVNTAGAANGSVLAYDGANWTVLTSAATLTCANLGA